MAKRCPCKPDTHDVGATPRRRSTARKPVRTPCARPPRSQRRLKSLCGKAGRAAHAGCALALFLAIAFGGCASDTQVGVTPDASGAHPAARGDTRYFFVVPQYLPDGRATNRLRDRLEKWLVAEAGGYTRVGPCRGGWHNGKDLIEQDNTAYFVVGPAKLKPEIEQWITRWFDQQQAFVVAW